MVDYACNMLLRVETSSDLAEVFSLSKPTVHRTLGRLRRGERITAPGISAGCGVSVADDRFIFRPPRDPLSKPGLPVDLRQRIFRQVIGLAKVRLP